MSVILSEDKLNYNAFFGFTDFPFSLIPNPNIFFPAESLLETINVLHYALVNSSLITILTGPPGVGKTQVLLTLLSKLDKTVIQPLEILNPAISPQELFQTIIVNVMNEEENSELITKNKDYILKRLKDNFIKENRRYLLIIDEAQLLPLDTLEELRLLTNLNEDNRVFLQIFLIGQPILSQKLERPELLPLRQRINVWEDLHPLKKEECLSYVWFRIKQVASAPNLTIDKNIEKVLYKSSKGVPRLINKIMDRALFIAYSRRETRITKDHLKEAISTYKEGLLEA